MGTLERPVRHGMLTKRSISKSKTTFNAKFQERWFVLTDKTLSYHTPNGQTVSGVISNLKCHYLIYFVNKSVMIFLVDVMNIDTMYYQQYYKIAKGIGPHKRLFSNIATLILDITVNNLSPGYFTAPLRGGGIAPPCPLKYFCPPP